MKWLFLLVLTGLTTASKLELGDRIVATEQECGRIFKLNENWNTINFNEQAAQYVDLYLICQDSLNEDKYAYIDKNRVDLSWYPGENDKFPVFTSDGDKYVTKPPQRKPKDEESMKKRLADFLTNTGGKMNPISRLMTMQSEMSQVIIDKQVECEVLALYLLKHPDDKDQESQHTDCMNNLNCIKEKFMEHHKFTREMYPDFFPILYKRKGTMIKTPPKLEKSVCETPDSPEGHKKELEKWMSGIEYIGEKIADIGEVGTDFIEKLVKKGMGGGDKVLTRDELNDLMTEVQSVTISDDDEDDDEDDENTYKVYGDVMIAKLAELEAKGVKIAEAKLEKVKPAIAKVESLASNTGEQLKKLEEVKIKPAIKNTAQGLSNAESNLKEKSLNALAEVKDGLKTAGSVAKTAAAKARGDGSILMSKIMSKSHDSGDNEEVTEVIQDHEEASTTSQSWLNALVDHMINPDYLPNNGDGQQLSLLKVLREMGGRDEDGKDKMSDDELVKMLKSLKESTKKKAKDLNLKKEEVKQSAEIIKGVMHALLFAASHGYGAAKDMNSQEIDTAKSLVNQLVDYATAEILDEVYEDDDDDDEEDESASNEAYVEGNRETQAETRDLSSDDIIQQEEESSTTKSDSGTTQDKTNITTSNIVPSQDNNTPVVDQEPEQTTADDRKDEDDRESNNNEGNPISKKTQDVTDMKY